MFGLESDSDDEPRALCVTRRDANVSRHSIFRGHQSHVIARLSRERDANARLTSVDDVCACVIQASARVLRDG